MKEYDVVIIGAGAAGLFAASLLCESNLKILILEKKSKIATKVLLSGAGQCNFSQNEPREEFIRHFYDKERFVKPAIYSLDSSSLVRYFNAMGLATMVRDDGKIFPASLSSSDLVKVLYDKLKKKVEIKRNSAAQSILNNNSVFVVKTNDANYCAKCLLLASGGFTYPSTGSTGDGYDFAKSLGHTVLEPRRALAAFTIKDYPFADCAGVSIENVELCAVDVNGIKQLMQGDLLFTHKGISGPVVLHMSRYLSCGSQLFVSLVNFEDKEEFRFIFKELCQQKRGQEIKTLLSSFLPKRLGLSLLNYLLIEADKKISQLNKKELTKIFNALTAMPLSVAKLASNEQAMVSAGGVDTSEIFPNTMQSKIKPGVYFAGELIDVDGESGGYNIHWAFASAALAAKDIMKRLLEAS